MANGSGFSSLMLSRRSRGENSNVKEHDREGERSESVPESSEELHEELVLTDESDSDSESVADWTDSFSAIMCDFESILEPL